MDFFDHQDRARRRSRWLVLWFVLAVVAIVLSVYTACVLTIFGFFSKIEPGQGYATAWWQPDLFLYVAVATLAIIGLGSLYKTAQVSAGGGVVAEGLGGRPIDPATTDLRERRLLNVVEEMALAAGLPVPTVYLLEREKGINAFAAGLQAENAVIGVTAGCLDLLSRDELQGVIGHEFSHVLNGDMRLNLRLMGLLHGILVIALIGYWLLRSASWGSSSSRRGGGGAAIALLALALLLIGWIGVFFGRLIKSGVSRQREFLADAAAVQFTRDPSGLAGALKKIGGAASGSRLDSPRAEEASHLFFGNALRPAFLQALATHPPLPDRIRRLEPSWQGDFPTLERPVPAVSVTPGEESIGGVAGLAGGAVAAEPQRLAPDSEGRVDADPAAVVARVGTLDEENRRYVASLLEGLPAGLRTAVREPAGAVAVVYALLLNDEQEVRRRQLDHLRGSVEPFVAELSEKCWPLLQGEGRLLRLPLLDLAVPALRELSAPQFETFWENVRVLVTADERVTLFEYTLQRLLERHLAPTFGRPESRRGRRPEDLGGEISVLLSALAQVDGSEEAERAFDSGAAELRQLVGGLRLLPPSESTLHRVDRALRSLAALAPNLKRHLVRAAAATVIQDGQVTLEEGELLRAVADALGCPMPPLLPGQTLSSSG